MKLVIVGSRKVEPNALLVARIAAALALASEEPDSHLLVRSNTSNLVMSRVDDVALDIANYLDISHTYFLPHGAGRSGAYQRDWAMVVGADRVMAFLPQGRETEGGTAHIVHAAISKGVPVEAWSVDSAGMLTLIGSDDGYEMDSEGIEWFHKQWEISQLNDYEEEIHKRISGIYGVPPELISTATPSTIGTTTTTTTWPMATKTWTNSKTFSGS